MIGSDQGRLFEVGFNLGFLAFLENHQVAPQWMQFYHRDLQNLKFVPILKRLIIKAGTVSSLDKHIIKNWAQFLLLKGFLSGFNFLGEYLKAFGWDESRKLKNLEFLYFQCSFTDDNSFNTYPKGEAVAFTELLTHFSENVKQFKPMDLKKYLQKYQQKGEFLKADTLIFLRYKNEYRILTVDLSLFSLKTENTLTNLEFVELIKRQLIQEINYFRSKSVFSRLRIDTQGEDFSFSPGIKQYFTAFKYEDKESCKLIQAGSYAASFLSFLQKIDFLPQNLVVSVVGYTNRGMSSITLNQNNRALLNTCQEIYQNDPSEKEINNARRDVLNQIKRQGFRSFDNGKNFVDSLFKIPANKITLISHQEKIEGFENTVNLRNDHAKLIDQALVSEDVYIFLTGNPGIGKTTAIANFLQTHFDEGFLFFYVSPRKQVNLDIIDKFKNPNTGKLDNSLFCLNSNSHLTSTNSTYTVQYLSEKYHRTFTRQGVTFLDVREEHFQKQEKSHTRFHRETEDIIQPAEKTNKGVIASICEATHTLIEENISNQIIASVCIQALKKTRVGDTLDNFGKIFKGAYNKKLDKVIPHKMKEISQRYQHLFIMVDEITGDESGAEFLKRMNQIIGKYELTQHGFNTKIIVADASIVEKNVIEQHLKESDPEPDKIFFRKAKSTVKPLSEEKFMFNKLGGIVINANSYPAKSLDITYKVIVNSCKFKAEAKLKEKQDDLFNKLQGEILQDLENIWEKEGQILVYIQDKKRLHFLIEKLRKNLENFDKYIDYLEVHANIGEQERQEIQKYKNQVKVIFMTSSGSRGLSFPRVKHILVDIPRFNLETNLMEIIQVIYRGRGDRDLDKQEKQLIFYLGEKAVYYEDNNPEIALQESFLNVLNILLLLKASIMTRIEGAGVLGREKVMIIPVGGKSVSATGESFSQRMANLLRELKQESKVKPQDLRLKNTHTQLKQLLGKADFMLFQNQSKISYLALEEHLQQGFLEIIKKGFDGLLKLGNIESGYVAGSLIIVPIEEKKLTENYEIRLDELIKRSPVLKDLSQISKDGNYHDNLRYAVKEAIDLMEKLTEQLERSQNIEEQSKRWDQYYTLPLFSFLNGKVLQEYFVKTVEEEDNMFREILEAYLRCLYSVDNILPLGENYEKFPFIVFNSYSLEEMRNKVFTDKYLLNSHELNVLNLILSKAE